MDLITPGLGLLFWQTIVFLVVLFILSRFAWKPITKALAEREHNIDSALKAAEKARSEMAQLTSQNEKLLQEARRERDNLLKDAQSNAVAIIAEAREEAARKAAADLEAARQLIKTEKNAAITELKNQVAAFSIEIAEKVIRKQLSNDAAQKELVESYIKQQNLGTN